jgi:hypothetical protein
MTDPGQLERFIAELVALERTVDPGIRAYPFKPPRAPELPAIWNWLPGESPQEKQTATMPARVRDTIRISALLGVKHSDVDEEMYALVRYADAFMAVVDPAFDRNQPLNGSVHRIKRTGLRTAIDDFPGVEVLCFEFFIEAQLDRQF